MWDKQMSSELLKLCLTTRMSDDNTCILVIVLYTTVTVSHTIILTLSTVTKEQDQTKKTHNSSKN